METDFLCEGPGGWWAPGSPFGLLLCCWRLKVDLDAAYSVSKLNSIKLYLQIQKEV